MGKIIFILLITNYSLITVKAQWQTDVRLTNDPASSLISRNNAWCVASNGDVVHVVWYDNRDGNYEIYYKRSTDGGVSWGADSRLTNNPAFSQYPSVSVSGQVVHVVWTDNRDGNGEIYYKCSTGGGVSWGTDTRLTNNGGLSWDPSVSVFGQFVHVVWGDSRDGNYEIYYKRSTDNGISWGADSRLTNDPVGSSNPSVSVAGSVVHVVWFDEDEWEIYYKRSTNGGVSWGTDTRLTNNTAFSQHPSVSASSNAVHVVWSDNRDTTPEIYYKRSTDAGVNWGTDTRLTFNFNSSQLPSVCVSGQVVHVVWTGDRDGNYEVYYKRSTDGGTSWGLDERLTNNSAISQISSITVSGQVVHVVWHDNRDGNWEIYYKRDPTGNPIGIQIISSEVPQDFSLSQNYPNPFNPGTKIRFAIPNVGTVPRTVRLIIYDALGREITTLVNEQLNPGTYEVDWDASNYPSGVYFYKLVVGDNTNNGVGFTETKKMVLIK